MCAGPSVCGGELDATIGNGYKSQKVAKYVPQGSKQPVQPADETLKVRGNKLKDLK